MNVIRLTINQVSGLWDSIRYGIIEAVFPKVKPDGQALQEILCRLLKEEMQCWCAYNDEKKIYGYMITSIDNELGKKVLFIYSEYLFNRLPSVEIYRDISDKIEQFAKANGCHRIMGYSSNPNAISMARKLGYSSDFTVLMKEV